MNQKFNAAVQQRDEASYVKLSGVIDEDNGLGDLTEKIPGGTVVIDLGEVERINSCGVRDWVNWLTKIEKSGAHPVLVECSPAIVAQINLVNNFTGGGAVKSFFAPYFCPACDHEKVLLVEASEMGPPPHKAPTCRCDECDGVMDFDDMEESYFAFLSSAKKVAKDTAVSKVISDVGGNDSERAKIRSRTSTTSLSSPGSSVSSLPSVPSLPSLSRGGNTGVGTGPGSSSFSNPGRTGTGSGSSSRPGNPSASEVLSAIKTGQFQVASAAQQEPPRTSKMIYVVIGVLILAIALIAYLVIGGSSKKSSGDARPPASDTTV